MKTLIPRTAFGLCFALSFLGGCATMTQTLDPFPDPRQIKIMDLNQVRNEADLIWPGDRARKCLLVMGATNTAEGQRFEWNDYIPDLPEFTANFRVAAGETELAAYEVSEMSVKTTHVLRNMGLNGYLPNPRKGNWDASELQPGQRYSFEVVFENPPPPGLSLWVSYLER